MIKTAEATGKTIDAARAAACRELGIPEDEGSMEILTLPKTGFLGIGAVPAKVRVTLELPDAPRSQHKAGKERRHESRGQARSVPAKAAPKAAQPAVSYEAGSREEKVDSFLRGLLERMDIQADITITPREGGGLNVELSGENMGAVIGRRGETLDAIQHLTNYALNRGGERHSHISVDAEAYRSKREDSLVHLAEKMAAKALKYKRSMALEPMNSYERHVIHTALQNYEGVTTSSIGSEPNRRVVVSCTGSGESSRREHSERSSRPTRERSHSSAREAAKEAPKAAGPHIQETAAPASAPLPPDFPEGYEPPTKNKPTSREWC